MSRFYTFAYTVAFRPWERAGRAGAEQLRSLLPPAPSSDGPKGVAVDIGCGTGAHTIELARRGWDAIGVDNQPKAIRLAREQARKDGSGATFVEADVTALEEAAIPRDVALFLDIGCFHDLPAEDRKRLASSMTALAAPGATLLLLAFQPGRRGVLPRGADQRELEAALAGWTTVSAVPAVTDGMPRPLRKAAPTWYRVERI